MVRLLKNDTTQQYGRTVRLYMYKEQEQWLERAACLSGYSKSEIVRMALDEFRKKVRLPETGGRGDCDGG